MPRPRLSHAAAAVGLLLAGAAAGDELVVTAEDVIARQCLGTPACRIGALELTAGPTPQARLTRQHYSGVTGIGVAATDTGADRDDEIQGPILDRGLAGESVILAFDRPHRIARLVVAHLYNPDMPGDPPETAVIEGFRAGQSLGALRLTSVDDDLGAFALEGTAGVGAVRRLDTLAGQYVLFEPFDGAVDRVVLGAAPVPSGDTADYSFVALTAAPGT